jgi:CheY-like chemotaxis protein
MPRLLLVDDNPSIHRIAESLLAPTDVELVCVASAAEALDRIGRGERFDVALVDTAMPGMDGWALLDRLRGLEETVHMPIALMAGVLDPVDPSRLAKAPIQGFLKKPIELRELGDRVKALLATPVVVSPSPFNTVPATPAKELVKHAGEPLPELRSEPAEVPTGLVDVELDLPEPEDDLLVLTAEDLWPEDSAPAIPEPALPTPAAQDVPLELEEVDFESVQDLALEPLGETGPLSGLLPEPVSVPKPERALLVGGDHLLTLSGLEELETVPTDFIDTPPPEVPEPVAAPDDSLAHLPVASTLLELGGEAEIAALAVHAFLHEAEEPGPVAHEPAPVIHEPAPVTHEPVSLPEIVEPPAVSAAAVGQAPAAPGHDTLVPAEPEAVTSEQARAVVQALLADSELVDVLAKALVARLGDQVLREIAWEVMPDLAGRLQR